MAHKEDLRKWLIEALKAHAGNASIVKLSKYIWENYESELRNSGDLFYTWQYDVRWIATRLRKEGVMRSTDLSTRGTWELM
ncbi:MAG: hypothetical protein PVF15_01285 [Candidatus Bathyarchaeota archaeon]